MKDKKIKFSIEYIHSGDIEFSIGVEEASGKHFIGIPASHGPVDYEITYVLDESSYRLYPSNIEALENIARECIEKKREHTLFFPQTNEIKAEHVNSTFSRAQQDSSASNCNTPLKEAFREAKDANNIELILPALLQAQLYVIVIENEKGKAEFFMRKSPQPNRLCVTVAENCDDLRSVSWPKQLLSGRELLKLLPKMAELIFVYSDGGNYLTREHLDRFREILERKPQK